MLIHCPYCHKELYASNWVLIFKGRNSLVCPACRRFIFHALRSRLLVMQGVIAVAAVAFCAVLGRQNIPGGFVGKALALTASVALIVAMGELSARWISRPKQLQWATDLELGREKRKAEEKRLEERKAAAKKKRKKK